MSAAKEDLFDVIVVGAGSAGCVVASRLSEVAERQVCLIEAGEKATDPRIADPLQWPFLQGSTIDWAYRTTPQKGTAGRVHDWPRGRVVGGSSCMHAMAHVRGHPSDFEPWAEVDPGWSFDSLLPYFIASERFSGGASDRHGDAGPLDVFLPERIHPLAEAYMLAGEELGIAPSGDHNGHRMEGPARNSLTIRGGRRCTLADAYLIPVLGRTNLTLISGAHVERVRVSDDLVTGVDAVVGSSPRRLSAPLVVLCSGTVASPLLLMRSGIGPADELRRHGIAPCRDLQAVGANLHDHLLAAGNVYKARQPVPPSTSQHSESLMYLRRGAGPAPDLVLACVTLPVVTEAFTRPDVGSAFTIMCGLTHPTSRGRLRLSGPGTLDPPVIDPAYLSTGHDRLQFRQSIRLAREVGHARALDDWRSEELLPGPGIQSDRDLDDFLALAATTHHHPVGTCAMGCDPENSVVDGTLRVHGIRGLRVVDASVIPSIPTGPVNAAVVAIAERAADMIAAG